MVVVDARKTAPGTVEGRITAGSRRYDLFFRGDRELTEHVADTFLLLALPAAMRRAEALVIEPPVSARLLGQVSQIQSLYHSWDRGLNEIEIRASARPAAAPDSAVSAQREAIAFTAGVDSLYSALQNPRASLVFISGLDVPLGNRTLLQKVRERVRWAASRMRSPVRVSV